MTDYLSFHNDPAKKAKYLARVRAHIAADELVRGTGWDGSRGCAVGCTLDAYDHSRYPAELGLPEWLGWLEDTLFEGMSELKSRTWPEDFLLAIPPGVDNDQFTRRVKAPFLVYALSGTLKTFDVDSHPADAAVVQGTIALWQRDDIGSSSWAEAVKVARAVEEEVASAVEEEAAEAVEVARAVRAAAWVAVAPVSWATAKWAAMVVAPAAAAAAAGAAWAAGAEVEATYDDYADKLLSLLGELEAA